MFALKQENNNLLYIFGSRVIFQIKCAKPILTLMQFTFKTLHTQHFIDVFHLPGYDFMYLHLKEEKVDF